MALTYRMLATKPQILLRLTGVTVNSFQEIVKRISKEWEQKVLLKKKCEGRTSKLKTLEDKVLVLLMYYRTYLKKANPCLVFQINM